MNLPLPPASIVAVASGKGGVGKTSLTLNIATLLAKSGKKVLVFDGDTGLANLDVQLNIKPERDLADVLAGTHSLAEVITQATQGFGLIAGRAGASTMASISTSQLHNILNQLKEISKNYDVTLLDVAAGVDTTALTLCAFAGTTLLITTPDPSALTDAYALIKLLWQRNGTANCQLLINQANSREADQVHKKLNTATQNFLGLPPLPMVGSIPSDKTYQTAVRMHQLAAISFPSTPAIEALYNALFQ